MKNRRLYEEALEIQDACNLSGILLSFKRAIEGILDEMRGVPSTQTRSEIIASHPVFVLWMDKIHDRAGWQKYQGDGYLSMFAKAYDEAQAVLSVLPSNGMMAGG